VDKSLNEFLYLTRRYYFRRDLFQGKGGNISVKMNSQEMIIKSSGVRINEISEQFGYSIVSIYKALELLNDSNLKDSKKNLDLIKFFGKTPSMETYFHSITKKYTIHAHPTVVNIISTQKDYARIFKMIFPESIIVKYITPGISLSREINSSISKNDKKNSSQIIFLQNHGIIVSSNDLNEVIRTFDFCIETISKHLNLPLVKSKYANYIYKELNKFSHNKYVLECFNTEIRQSISNQNFIQNINLTPDSTLFLGSNFLFVEKLEDLEIKLKNYVALYESPNVIILDGDVFLIGDSLNHAKDIEEILHQVALIYKNSSIEEINLLSKTSIDEILGLDIEKYRKKGDN
jgi:rhamnose utilization protein RhaD (predicted bifunctional aldolase and dehydrogenase)